MSQFFNNDNIRTTFVQKVPCQFSPTGLHYVVIMLGVTQRHDEERVVYLSCECEEGNRNAVEGMHLLNDGHSNFCYTVVADIRKFLQEGDDSLLKARVPYCFVNVLRGFCEGVDDTRRKRRQEHIEPSLAINNSLTKVFNEVARFSEYRGLFIIKPPTAVEQSYLEVYKNNIVTTRAISAKEVAKWGRNTQVLRYQNGGPASDLSGLLALRLAGQWYISANRIPMPSPAGVISGTCPYTFQAMSEITMPNWRRCNLCNKNFDRRVRHSETAKHLSLFHTRILMGLKATSAYGLKLYKRHGARYFAPSKGRPPASEKYTKLIWTSSNGDTTYDNQ